VGRRRAQSACAQSVLCVERRSTAPKASSARLSGSSFGFRVQVSAFGFRFRVRVQVSAFGFRFRLSGSAPENEAPSGMSAYWMSEISLPPPRKGPRIERRSTAPTAAGRRRREGRGAHPKVNSGTSSGALSAVSCRASKLPPAKRCGALAAPATGPPAPWHACPCRSARRFQLPASAPATWAKVNCRPAPVEPPTPMLPQPSRLSTLPQPPSLLAKLAHNSGPCWASRGESAVRNVQG